MMVNFKKNFATAKNNHEEAKRRIFKVVSLYLETKVFLGGTVLVFLLMCPINGWLSTRLYLSFKKTHMEGGGAKTAED